MDVFFQKERANKCLKRTAQRFFATQQRGASRISLFSHRRRCAVSVVKIIFVACVAPIYTEFRSVAQFCMQANRRKTVNGRLQSLRHKCKKRFLRFFILATFFTFL